MINKYPIFILKENVVASIREKDETFADKLTDPAQSFTFEGAYFAPAMDGHVIRIPFTYVPQPLEFGIGIFKDFNKMKAYEMAQKPKK